MESAVLLTLLYDDLFDAPMEEARIHELLIAPSRDPERTLDAIRRLERSDRISRRDGWVCLAGHEGNFGIRDRRRRTSAARWPSARRFAYWAAWIPFVRMVAVCGSQAVNNGDRDADVDFFLITVPGRLWIVHFAVMAIKRFAGLIGIEACPNFLITSDHLTLEQRNLYTAREVVQAVPIWGEDQYRRFLEHNRWVSEFLPQVGFGVGGRRPAEKREHGITRALEWLLGGGAGELLDRFLHVLFVNYYCLRLYRRGWRRPDIEDAYRRDRQSVIRGGFRQAVRRCYLDRAQSLVGSHVSSESLTQLFDGDQQHAQVDPDAVFRRLFVGRYGLATREQP